MPHWISGVTVSMLERAATERETEEESRIRSGFLSLQGITE